MSRGSIVDRRAIQQLCKLITYADVCTDRLTEQELHELYVLSRNLRQSCAAALGVRAGQSHCSECGVVFDGRG